MNTLSLYQKSLRGGLNDAELAALEETLLKHPYFSLAHYIRAKQDASHEYLFVASTYSPNRSLLRQYMDGNSLLMMDTEPPQEVKKQEKPVRELHKTRNEDLFSVVDFDALSTDLEPADAMFSATLPIKSEINAWIDTRIKIGSVKWMYLVDAVRAEINHYSHATPLFAAENAQVQPLLPNPDSVVAAHQVAKAEKLSLLDEFLKSRPEMPRINPSEPMLQDTAAAASIVEEGEIVTETLARIHLMQGNKREALNMYQKLRLLFPEKIPYFDVQIAKINDQI